MSTDFNFDKKISMAALFDGCLEVFGIREHQNKDTAVDRRCLTDGDNYLWANGDDDGMLSSMARYAGNDGSYMLRCIGEHFDMNIYSEYTPQYWGFATQEEWDAFTDETGKQYQEQFYQQLIRFVTNQGNDFPTGTIGELKAEIARHLVKKAPELVCPQNRERLMKEVEERYEKTQRRFTYRLDLNELLKQEHFGTKQPIEQSG